MSFGSFKFGATAPAASTSTAPAAPSFSLTGAAPPTQAPAANATQPFSFGSSQPAQPAAGSGLFGSTSQPQQQPASGGLFGGGLFGAKPAQTSSSGLFGASQQPPQQPSLFGQSTQQPTSNSLFQSQQQPPQNNIFGQPQAQQQQQQQSNIFGQAQSQQQNSTAGPSGINKTTKYADLPEPIQKTIEQMDSWIKQQKAAGGDLNIEGLGSVIWQTSSDVQAANEEYSALSQGLTSLQSSLNQLRVKVLSEEEDLRKIAEIWETFKSVDGRPGAVRVAAHRDFPQDFFSRAAQGMEDRVQRYKKTISQLNRAILSLSREHDTPSPQAIAQTIQTHQNALLTLAAQLEDLQLRMGDLKQRFSEEYRERTNSMRDPFEVARQEKGLPVV